MSGINVVPVPVAMLETPAGFQPNAHQVYLKIGEFYEKSLQNFRPQLQYVNAWKKGTLHDPDDPDVLRALLGARYIFSGPGSPTYAARNLTSTLAERYLVQAFDDGATIVLASAAAIAAGSHVMRVYEIFKAGDELGWDKGLSLLPAMGFGVDPVIVTHWNNTEGGAGLDTSHCYVGEERFLKMVEMLPPQTPILGIDEHTACIFEPDSDEIKVMGAGRVTILRGAETHGIPAGEIFPLDLLKSASPAPSYS